jgi:hypothetical protein
MLSFSSARTFRYRQEALRHFVPYLIRKRAGHARITKAYFQDACSHNITLRGSFRFLQLEIIYKPSLENTAGCQTKLKNVHL